MARPATAADGPPDDAEPPQAQEGRIRHTLSGWRRLARIVYRDPEHVAERLTLYSAQHLAEPSLEWAKRTRDERPDTPRAVIADELRTQSAQVARIDGAVSGTPFLIAFVPGYLAYLWQEGRMVLRTAALYDHDPRQLTTSAEMLALRGVHPTVDAARAALLGVRDVPLPDKPARRRPLRAWVHSVYVMLIFGGFLAAPSDERDESAHPRLKTAFGLLTGGVIWMGTWVFPVTFMILMAWGCETHARQLGRRALAFYGDEADTAQAAIAAAEKKQDRGHDKRAILRTTFLALSVVVPMGIVAYVVHTSKSSDVGWLTAIGAIVAFSLVLATSVIASRR